MGSSAVLGKNALPCSPCPFLDQSGGSEMQKCLPHRCRVLQLLETFALPPTHHCPTPSMSEEDPHPPRGVQSSIRPHEVGWKEGQQGEFKIKKNSPNASAASPLQADLEEARGLRWERYARLRGEVLCMPGGSGTS